jgi:hypothetical protein
MNAHLIASLELDQLAGEVRIYQDQDPMEQKRIMATTSKVKIFLSHGAAEDEGGQNKCAIFQGHHYPKNASEVLPRLMKRPDDATMSANGETHRCAASVCGRELRFGSGGRQKRDVKQVTR